VKTVRDIMTPNPTTCTPETPLRDVARMMVDRDCGAIPVLESATSRRPIGTVTDRDIVCRIVAKGEDPARRLVQHCMTTPCVTVPVDGDIAAARDAMCAHRIRRIVAVDENADCVGIVAIADLVRETHDAEVIREVSEPKEEPANVREPETA